MAEINLELVIFDMDGLMFDTERLSFWAWREVGSKCGYSIDEELYKKTLGINSRATDQVYLDHFGQDFPIKSMRIEKDKFLDEYLSSKGIPVKDGLYDLLDFLKYKNLKKAVATSTSRESALALLKLAGVDEYFDNILCGDEIEKSKPNPEIFLKSASKLNCPPEKCLVLEDSEAGVIAANTAGMLTVMIPDMKQPGEEIKKLVYKQLNSLHDVKCLLEDILKL